MLALIAPRNWQKLGFFVLAALAGYSRVYLSQHFLIDITVGSVIGITIIMLLFLWAGNWEKPWLDKSLIRKK
jgi:membrane-associated phospholipid phosphatase